MWFVKIWIVVDGTVYFNQDEEIYPSLNQVDCYKEKDVSSNIRKKLFLFRKNKKRN